MRELWGRSRYVWNSSQTCITYQRMLAILILQYQRRESCTVGWSWLIQESHTHFEQQAAKEKCNGQAGLDYNKRECVQIPSPP